jgi:ParB family transcriptional regulator, chromosome partitioning protein
MSDYIVNMDVDRLKPNPINSDIYENNQKQLNELRDSIQQNGLLEPIVIDESDMVLSGHRRLMALKMIGIREVDCRLTKYSNTTIATIELNRYRNKSHLEINREIQVLDFEYKKEIPRGRPLKDEIRNLKVSSMEKVARSLGVSLTKAKKIKSIGRYEPQLLQKIDMGIISLQKAYNYVQTKYKNKDMDSKYDDKKFKSSVLRLLKQYKPKKEFVNDVINNFYND